VLASASIQAVRDAGAACAAPTCGVALPVAGAVVTSLRPALGVDAAGFTLQAARAGPALLVLVDPATLLPAPVVGDEVSLTVTQVARVNGWPAATALAGLSVDAVGRDTAALVQDLGPATDLVAGLPGYLDELASVAGAVTGAFTASGSGFQAAPFSTAGVPSSANLRVRVAASTLAAADLVPGCTLTVGPAPIGAFSSQVQVTARGPSDLSSIQCPAPKVAAAAATSATSLVVTFDRNLDASSVRPDGGDFAISGGPGAVVVAAAVTVGRTVTLTTSPQSPGAAYSVTVAGTVRDTLGAGVDPQAASASFTGF
jgi:hypothetical protein